MAGQLLYRVSSSLCSFYAEQNFGNNLAINLLVKFIDTDDYDINNPFDSHRSSQKAGFYNIFWGVGKNDLLKNIHISTAKQKVRKDNAKISQII